MRRFALLLAGAAVWLFLLAIPAFADGGPHISTLNNGTGPGGLTSDSCAGCHRAHTAQAAYLLKEEVPGLCLSCHDSAGAGATTDVEGGLQYVPATGGERSGTTLGALRAGGFKNAFIASDQGVKLAYWRSATDVSFLPKVPVRSASQAVTSKHMSLSSLASAKVWGNGALGAGTGVDGAGGTTTLNCTSCHNPHGNGQYRILNKQPAGEGGDAVFPAVDAIVTDGPTLVPVAGVYPTRNYTVQQWNPTTSTRMLLASDVTAGGFGWQAGDYFHRKVPWNSTVSSNVDKPNGVAATDATGFNSQINVWCSQCHTRYLAVGPEPYKTDSGDLIFKYRHPNTSNKPCTTCHVAHGSNAQMTGFNSTHQYYPGQGTDPSTVANADSRLLKVDNRGTCQMCHDPTNTTVPPGTVGSPPGAQIGPTPVPLIP